MIKIKKEYSFVLDSNGKKLSPTPTNNAWYLIRKKKAKLECKYPMVIKLNKEIVEDQDGSVFIFGIDDGSLHVGVGIVQKCKTKNKVIFKWTIEQRKDVKGLIEERKEFRRYRKKNKRYRPERFNNRFASKRKDRIAPSIKQKKQSTLRVINRLNKYINIQEFRLEDVAIDIRSLTDGTKLYKWQYQKLNRLDENLRKATLLRDNCTCMECGAKVIKLEAHHIVPKRLKGSDTISNLITLCSKCHDKTKGKEELFIKRYQKLINGESIRLDYAQHVMQGKTYLRKELSKLGILRLTNGGDTANKRIDWNIEKSHSNDALCIIGLEVKPDRCEIKDWIIKPIRRKSKVQKEHSHCFKHGDVVKYINKKKYIIIGKINSMRKSNGYCKVVNFNGDEFGPMSPKSLKLVWRYNKIYFI